MSLEQKQVKPLGKINHFVYGSIDRLHNFRCRHEPYLYESGWKDGAAVFFYTLICIIMHAILQEYVLDVSRLSHTNANH